MVRAAPGRGASTSPSSPSTANRWRHLPTVVGWQPNLAAISPWRSPCAHANTILLRNANACDDECRCAQRCNVLRSSALKMISTVGRPRRAMVSLRCWAITPNERDYTAGIPDQPRLLSETTFQDTSAIAYIAARALEEGARRQGGSPC